MIANESFVVRPIGRQRIVIENITFAEVCPSSRANGRTGGRVLGRLRYTFLLPKAFSS